MICKRKTSFGVVLCCQKTSYDVYEYVNKFVTNEESFGTIFLDLILYGFFSRGRRINERKMLGARLLKIEICGTFYFEQGFLNYEEKFQ